MEPTNYPQVNTLLSDLLSQMQAIFGDKLIGLYLHGSLVVGDFDPTVSDVDLLVALASDLTDAEFTALDQMHQRIVAADPQWHERLEIGYLSLYGLQTFKTEESRFGIISPGEPFHLIETGKDYLINWYAVLHDGKTLFGAPPETIIAPVSKDEFIESVKDYVRVWRGRMPHITPHQGSQAYAILTMCRSLYTCQYEEQVSKVQAAQWATGAFPEWAALIQNAVIWRENSHSDQAGDDASTVPETQRFIQFVLDYLKL